MKYQYILFDLDGTVTNPEEGITKSFAYALEHMGIHVEDRSELRKVIGPPLLQSFDEFYHFTKEQAMEATAKYRERYGVKGWAENEVYDGVEEMLHWLAEKGLKLCVFSNKPHMDTCRVVAHFFPHVKFDHVRGAMDGVAVKPDPAGAWLAAQALGVKPEECLYLGDTSVDMHCARNAGMHPVGVTWGFREEDELRESGAEILIHHPSELKDKINL